jgi:hypothetical protein
MIQQIVKEEIIRQGAALIEKELSQQVDMVVDLRQEIEIRDSDLVGTSIAINKSLHQNIKNKIQENRANVRKLIAATAYYIETEKRKSLNGIPLKADLSKLHKARLNELIRAQNELSLSYSTLVTVVEFYKEINKSVLNQLQDIQNSSSSSKQIAFLKNAILIYELTDFVIDSIENYKINGIDEIFEIKKQIFDEIRTGEKDDKTLAANAQEVSQAQKESVLQEIKSRNMFRGKITKKWDDITAKLDGQNEKVKESRQFLNALKVTRANAKGRIDVLNLAQTTRLVSDAVDSVDALATGIAEWELPPIDERTACELLNLEFGNE